MTTTADPAALLAEIDDRLVAALARVTLLPDTADRIQEAGQVILAGRLRMARRAVADLILYSQTPARRDPMEARSQSFPAVATTGGPDTFALPPIPTVPSFDNGRCRA